VSSKNITKLSLDPDAFKSMDYFCESNGYSWEKYDVTTEDGYILNLWRIPGRKGDDSADKAPVLLQPCLDCDMMVWVSNSADKAPAFLLVDAGYDVWLGNNRGTRYGYSHVSMDPSQK